MPRAWTSIPIAVVAAAVLAGGGTAAPERSLPARGELVAGVSLGGIRLGDTAAQVRAAWGTRFVRCRTCRAASWYYTLPETTAGAAVVFRGGRVAAVFTLGSPFGWRTREGLRVGELIERVVDLYPQATGRGCIGYGALSWRSPGAVSSVYLFGEVVYGFALTRPGEPVCQ